MTELQKIMKKSLSVIFLFLFSVFSVFTEEFIVDYKGMANGMDAWPKWLTQLFDDDSSKLLRKKFKLSSTDRIFYASEEDENFDVAKEKAKLSAAKKAAEGTGKDSVSILSGLTPVTDFWQIIEDDRSKKKYTVYYEVYKISDNSK